MAGDMLAMLISGCSIEQQFGISGHIMIWQQSHLSSRTISDI